MRQQESAANWCGHVATKSRASMRGNARMFVKSNVKAGEQIIIADKALRWGRAVFFLAQRGRFLKAELKQLE